jgi:uncharacterized spore protein YtfJ
VLVTVTGGCAAGASAISASTYTTASSYGSASAHVPLEPAAAFDPAVRYLLGREDIKLIDLTEADSRCTAVAGDRRLTFRVIETSPGRSRLSMIVGGSGETAKNQEWADGLLRQICRQLDVGCEFASGGS